MAKTIPPGILCLLGGLAWLGCGALEPALPAPDPGLSDLALTQLGPSTIVPGSELVLSGRGFPSPGDGPISLLLSGQVKALGGDQLPFEVRLRADYTSPTAARVLLGPELFAALGVTDGSIDGQAVLIVDSAIDLTAHAAAPLAISLQVASVLLPRLDGVELVVGKLDQRVHPNDWVMVHGAWRPPAARRQRGADGGRARRLLPARGGY
jgi:hypothetical protein